MDVFEESWNWFSGEVHDLAREKGWWDADRSFLECMGLVISELGEAVEAFRSPKCSTKILAHSHAAEELADIVIRLADTCRHFSIDIPRTNWAQKQTSIFSIVPSGADEDAFVACINALMGWNACDHKDRNPVEMVALIASVLGHAIYEFQFEQFPEAADNMMFSMVGICRLAAKEDINLGEAIIAKHAYNKSRTYRHGAKLY